MFIGFAFAASASCQPPLLTLLAVNALMAGAQNSSVDFLFTEFSMKDRI